MVTPYNRINQFKMVTHRQRLLRSHLSYPQSVTPRTDSPSKPSPKFLSWFFLKILPQISLFLKTFPKPPSLWSGEAMAEKGLYYPLPKFSKGDLCLSVLPGSWVKKKVIFCETKGFQIQMKPTYVTLDLLLAILSPLQLVSMTPSHHFRCQSLVWQPWGVGWW